MGFDQEVDKAMEDLRNEINDVLEAGILKGWNIITAGTPVKSGRLRGSWFVSVDVLAQNSLPPGEYGPPPPPDFSFDIRHQRHLYIVNNVNYVEYIEFGTPRIEAFGMVQHAVPIIQAELETAFKMIKEVK